MQNQVRQAQMQQQMPFQQAAMSCYNAPVTSPVETNMPPCSNVQVPNYSGVNIQIFNPSVTPPGASAPVYNVNAPTYGPTSGTPGVIAAASATGGAYPQNYYMNQYGTVGGGTIQAQAPATEAQPKKEKRKIVELTDSYIMNLENYLNSQDTEVRLMGAKEVVARLQEDDTRANDRALNALNNKMLQDPSGKIRVLALSMLDSRLATGDATTVAVLRNMQASPQSYGMDSSAAAQILLKMSGQMIEKEFDVKQTPKKKDN